MHHRGIVAFDEVGLISLATEQGRYLVIAAAAKHRRPGDLVAVEVQDRKHGAVADRIEEVHAFPRALERTGFRLAIAHHADDEKIRVVERRTEGVREHISQLASFVDRAGCRNTDVARHASGSRELAEQPPHPRRILGNLRIDLGVGPLEVDIGQKSGPAVPRAGEVDHACTGLANQPVQMHVDKTQSGRGPPVTQKSSLDVLGSQRLAQQRIVLQVDLTDSEVIGRPPVGIELGDLFLR